MFSNPEGCCQWEVVLTRVAQMNEHADNEDKEHGCGQAGETVIHTPPLRADTLNYPDNSDDHGDCRGREGGN